MRYVGIIYGVCGSLFCMVVPVPLNHTLTNNRHGVTFKQGSKANSHKNPPQSALRWRQRRTTASGVQRSPGFRAVLFGATSEERTGSQSRVGKNSGIVTGDATANVWWPTCFTASKWTSRDSLDLVPSPGDDQAPVTIPQSFATVGSDPFLFCSQSASATPAGNVTSSLVWKGRSSSSWS